MVTEIRSEGTDGRKQEVTGAGTEIERLVRENETALLEAWNEYFS